MRKWILAFSLVSGLAAAAPAVLPNLDLTPGVSRHLSKHTICTTKWGLDKRHVTTTMKRQVFKEYGISCHPLTSKTGPRCGEWEIDHLKSRELAGADDVKNLWPESYHGKWNAHRKDRLENRLHKEYCAGHITLKAAQDAEVHD